MSLSPRGSDSLPSPDPTESVRDNATIGTGSQTRQDSTSTAGSGTYNVPLARTEDSSQVYGSDPNDSTSRYKRLAHESRDFVLGPMPPQDFLDTFCPCSPELLKKMPSARGAFDDVPMKADNEKLIYDPLIKALNAVVGEVSRCPGFTFRDTSNHPDTSGHAALKPDVICYANEHLERVQVFLKEPKPLIDKSKSRTTKSCTNKSKPLNDKPEPRISDSKSRTDMGYAAFFIEIKGQPSFDLFSDPPAPLASPRSHDLRGGYSTQDAPTCFGQNIAYATEISARQYRNHCFSLSMSGSQARLMRWDRAGLIITRSFDIKADPEFLCEFVWRFAHMTESERGLDLTVEPASKAEEEVFVKAIKAHVASQLSLRGRKLDAQIRDHYQEESVCVIHVATPDPTDPTVCHQRRFLVCRPLVSPLSLSGRATRVYWAVDSVTKEVVLLKDTWRFNVEGVELEGDVYLALNQRRVRNVPTLLCHGHVQCVVDNCSKKEHTACCSSKTQTFVDQPWVCAGGMEIQAIIEYRHYRLVHSVAGYSLAHITGSRELIHAGYDAFVAALDAHEPQPLRRLHRDISVGSIILFRKKGDSRRTGYLIDWELSWRVGFPDLHRMLPRDATWQFMSINVGAGSPKPHSIQDDMESLLYVAWFCSIRWLPHNNPSNLNFVQQQFLDISVWSAEKGYEGCSGKDYNLQNIGYWTDRVQLQDKELQRWLDTLMKFCRAEYKKDKKNKTVGTGVWADAVKTQRWWKESLDTFKLHSNNRADPGSQSGVGVKRKRDRLSLPATVASGSGRSRDNGQAPSVVEDPAASAAAEPPQGGEEVNELAEPGTWKPMNGLKGSLPIISHDAHEGRAASEEPPQKKARTKPKKTENATPGPSTDRR
ncbi:uncharacterized protein TRAVEDRAFT_52666 [Trametes versicolor FP-101664 SS1]|uniref:uncharacterized protein n=1 Tax=Trametes versicolor (strain FP-101664) TaxID=717944 RepID=UPI000462443A|nr:uncharacterized protein TRAVEDRAFT_52666 [Trametes versicolor FP-101664 SS1]EIW53538.1 hypothetical protein TRAVEDRAFT_52666 [Trametes versicolor FP-101664 SS1]